MRVSGGENKGRRLKAPTHIGLRPTSDKVKEALLSIMSGRVRGASWLDLFAGTGAVGVEALSRGAERVVFVDSSPQAEKLIRENVGLIGAGGSTTVVIKGVLAFIKQRAVELGPYDVVFLDPPYHEGIGPETMEALGRDSIAEALPEGSVVVYERHGKYETEESYGRLRLRREYKYGDTVLCVYDVVERG